MRKGVELFQGNLRRKRGGYPQGDKPGSGPEGKCKCTNSNCSYTVEHITGTPCNQRICVVCGSPLTRM